MSVYINYASSVTDTNFLFKKRNFITEQICCTVRLTVNYLSVVLWKLLWHTKSVTEPFMTLMLLL